MAEDDPKARPPRKRLFLAVYLLILLWAGAATMSWGGKLRDVGKLPTVLAWPLGSLSVAAALTTWPAHELLNAMAGHGFGANELSDLGVRSAVIFLVWCTILWSPMLSLWWRRAPIWLGAVVQIAVLLVVFALFWKYGNG